MKFESGVITLALMSAIAVEGMSIRGNTKQANKLLAFSRRLEDSGDEGESGDSGDSGESGDENNQESGDENNEESMDDEQRATYFLKDYSIKLLSCIQGQQVVNYENGEMESSTVVFRLCPSDSCDSSASIFGCDDGYGDYVVGIDTFLDAYMESQSDNNDDRYGNPMITYNQWGQEFDASEYLECSEYRQDDEEQQYYQQQQNYQGYYNGNGGGNQNMYYGNNNKDGDFNFFIGPGCSENGTSIALQMYMDDECTYSFEVEFSAFAPAWETLPFSDGGLVSMDCVSCYGADNDNNMEVSEMCIQEFQSSVARCEESMETDNYYHYSSTGGCDYVDSLLTSAYGNLTVDGTNSVVNNTLSAVKTTVSTAAKEVSTRFMDTMSTKEARAFIAGMVIFGLSFLIGVSFIGCLCVKKRRQRRVLKKKKASTLLPSGSDDSSSSQDDDLSIKKRRSSVVSLVRSSTNTIKESVSAAATGTKVAVVTAAAATVAAVTRSATKDEKDDDSTASIGYNNMEDATIGNGSYKAPESAPSYESTNTVEEIGTTETSDVAPAEAEPTDAERVTTPAAAVDTTPTPEASSAPVDVVQSKNSVTASEVTEKTRGSRFLSKMDKHLKKKLSVNSLSKKK